MKRIIATFVALPLAFSVFADDAAPKALSKVVGLGIASFGAATLELKTTKGETTNKVLVGVPVKVTLANGCTQLIGQKDYLVKTGFHHYNRAIALEGVTDPMMDVCEKTVPEPISATVYVEFTVGNLEDPSVTYYQDVLINNQWVRVQYAPVAKTGSVVVL